MNVLGATAHQFAPGCEDNTLVLQGFFECRVEHGEHIAPAERAAVADVGEVGAGVGTMHDHHGDAGLEVVEGVENGQTGVPGKGAERPDLRYLGVGESGLLPDQLVRQRACWS
jgi:hypothetical protein